MDVNSFNRLRADCAWGVAQYGSGHGGATVLLPGFANWEQNQVTRQPHLQTPTDIYSSHIPAHRNDTGCREPPSHRRQGQGPTYITY